MPSLQACLANPSVSSSLALPLSWWMFIMRNLKLALLIYLGLVSAAAAQVVTNPQSNAGIYGAYNTSLPTCVNGSGCWLQTDLNGNLKIAIASGGGSGGTASTFGAAFPATGTAIGFTDGTNMVAGRVRNPGSGAVTGDAAVVVVDPVVLAAINSATPAGANTIGNVKIVDTAGTNLGTVKPASTAPVATDTSIVTALNPNSPGIIALGQTTKSASVPVTIASDQYVDPCQSPNIAKSSVPINLTAAAGTTALVAVSGSTVVYVCGVAFTIAPSATTADSVLFEYGSGTACATSPVALTGTFGSGDLTTSAPLVTVNYGGAGSTIFKSAASNGICALTTGSVINIQGVMTYVQQ